MKHLRRVLLLIGLFVLVSCGANTNPYLGTYKFQMGSDKGTHFGVYMELTDEEVKDTTGNVQGKRFSLRLDMDGEGGSAGASSMLSSFLGNDFKLNGYYSVDEKTSRLNLGVNDLDKIIDPDSSTGIDIPANLVEKVMSANITTTDVTLILPVSIPDLLYQLYWYGYKISLTSDTIVEEIEKHDVETHPTKEEVEAIKTKEADNMLYSNFRDYHVIKMGLKK